MKMQLTKCFKVSYFWLILGGVWYPRSLENTRMLYAVNIYRVFGTIFINVGMLAIQFIYFFTVVGKDLDKTVDATALFTFVGYLYKAITVIKNRRRINKLLDIIDNETDKDDLLRNMAVNINFISYFYNGWACLTAIMWNLIPFTKATLTLPFYYPDLPPSSQWFVIWYIYQATILIINGVAQTSADHLFGGLMAFAATQLKLLQYKLEAIGTKTDSTMEIDEAINSTVQKHVSFAKTKNNPPFEYKRKRNQVDKNKTTIGNKIYYEKEVVEQQFLSKRCDLFNIYPYNASVARAEKELTANPMIRTQLPNKAQREQEDYEETISCVEYHLKIIWFVEELTDIFGGAAFGQFVLAAPLICLSMFIIMTSSDVTEIVTRILYFGCLSGQLFIYCFCGNLIKTQSDLVATAAYNSHWTSTSVRTQKALHLLVIRGQKTISVVAGNLFELSLVTFGALLKSSYSFFAVLRKQHDE
ncbi:odorant receptor coreceptor-like isoform X1 [Cydia splendana]|uniref:odorant receptor coreceptor-like isoform X1 n=1 Tax=Cydia splendana TaxID=1100963 RepID=UPI00300D5DCC